MGKPYHGWSCNCDDCIEQDQTRGWRDGEKDDLYDGWDEFIADMERAGNE